jgi:hypothetical protein
VGKTTVLEAPPDADGLVRLAAGAATEGALVALDDEEVSTGAAVTTGALDAVTAEGAGPGAGTGVGAGSGFTT